MDAGEEAPVLQGRDGACAARLLCDYAPDATVVACDLWSRVKTAAATLDDAVVVADVLHLLQLAPQALDEVRRRRQQRSSTASERRTPMTRSVLPATP